MFGIFYFVVRAKVDLLCLKLDFRGWDNHLILRGLANLVGTDYLFSSRVRPENLFPGKPTTEYLFSTATYFLKKTKTGWGSARVK